ncbi:zinc-ribbon domain-containing protein [Butyrivibrio sp. INlla14]|uniref:zinc-ribbon domain-containing protein n=1 Tax=Butyrivibrio sp. INlla14 TaxID=1520808 RepID=UPI0015A37A18|nr:zinc-ribbon domain-containing protein [Butyrivibrio sp. INlla14]
MRKYGSLKEEFPEIAKQWHPTKNGNVTPDMVASRIGKKAWWLGPCGHEWEAAISSRTKGIGCPFCRNLYALEGFNDLTTTHPELAKEWNYEKNGSLRPTNVTFGSRKKVWWKCEKGHEWEDAVKDRAKGKKCPYCTNQKVLPGFNDLLTVNPEAASEWNYEKNGTLTPDKVKYSANIKVWWKCAKGHEWEAFVFNKSKGHGCPYCSNFSALAGYNDLATLNPQLAEEWDHEKNVGIKPTDVTIGSKKKVWWKCTNGHEWEATVKSRVSGNNCPFCAGQAVLTGFNDLATTNPALAEEWNYKKNGKLRPTDVTAGTQMKVWWICANGHEWQATTNSRNRGNTCPYCSNNYVLAGYNDLATTHPDIAKEWDYEKNKEKPDEVLAGSNIKKYWFICPKGHSYSTTLLNRKKGTDCPICAMERHTSFPEKVICFYMKKYLDDIVENYHDSTIGRKEIDVFCPEHKFGVEYDGRAWHKNVQRDIAKDNDCLSAGITLFRVREIGCHEYKSTSIKKYIKPYDMQELKDAILSIFSFLNSKYQLNIDAIIDIDQDRAEILEQITLSEKGNSVAVRCPQIKEFWDYKKNGKITPEQISHSSMKKAFFKCKSGHTWEEVVSNFAARPWCPYCSGRKTWSGYNDLFTTNPELIPFWSKTNTIDPKTIKAGCNSKALWCCPNCGGEYEMVVAHKVKTPGCPYCSGHRVLKGYNDMATFRPDLVEEWDYEKNYPLMPDEVTKGSNKKVWWKCRICNNEWQAVIHSRAVLNRGCPICRRANS